jgi:hypothetical protein
MRRLIRPMNHASGLVLDQLCESAQRPGSEPAIVDGRSHSAKAHNMYGHRFLSSLIVSAALLRPDWARCSPQRKRGPSSKRAQSLFVSTIAHTRTITKRRPFAKLSNKRQTLAASALWPAREPAAGRAEDLLREALGNVRHYAAVCEGVQEQVQGAGVHQVTRAAHQLFSLHSSPNTALCCHQGD